MFKNQFHQIWKTIVTCLKYFANINVEDDDNVDRSWGGSGDPNAYGCFWKLEEKSHIIYVADLLIKFFFLDLFNWKVKHNWKIDFVQQQDTSLQVNLLIEHWQVWNLQYSSVLLTFDNGKMLIWIQRLPMLGSKQNHTNCPIICVVRFVWFCPTKDI
jgi:hypothetical protein